MMDDPTPRIRAMVRSAVRASGPLGLARRGSGIDELAEEIVAVCDRVESIQRVIDDTKPTLKRLAIALDGLEEQLRPIGSLACKMPRSKARRRRRRKNLAALEGTLNIVADAADPDRTIREVRATAEQAAERIDAAAPRATDGPRQ